MLLQDRLAKQGFAGPPLVVGDSSFSRMEVPPWESVDWEKMAAMFGLPRSRLTECKLGHLWVGCTDRHWQYYVQATSHRSM